MVSAAGDFVYAKFSEIKCYNSTFLLFLPSKVMILLAFLSCLLIFFFVKDQIASFQLKQIIVFLNYVFRVCVYFIAWLRASLIQIIEFSKTYGRFRVVLHAVDSLNFKHELRSKKIKQFCIMQIFLGLPLENRVLLFAWIKAKVHK